MRHQKKQKKNPKAVRVRVHVPSSTLHIQCDSCESCAFPYGIYSFKPAPDCGLDPTVPKAARLEELGVCFGFTHQLLIPADRGICFPQRDDNVLESSGQAAVVPAWTPQEGQSGGEKEGLGLSGVAWPLFSPSGIPTGYSRGWHMEGIKRNHDRNRVSGPRHQTRAEEICPGRYNGQRPVGLMYYSVSRNLNTTNKKEFFSHRLLNRD